MAEQPLGLSSEELQVIGPAVDVLRRARAHGTLLPSEAERLTKLEGFLNARGYQPEATATPPSVAEESLQESFNPANLLAPAAGLTRLLPALTAGHAATESGTGTTGATIGEIAGQIAAGLMPGQTMAAGALRGLGRIVGGGAGAGAGYAGERAARGEEVRGGDVALEAGLSAVPQGIEEGARSIWRSGARRSFAGRRLRGQATKERMEAEVGDIVRAPERGVVNDLYDQVRKSDVVVYTDYADNPVKRFFGRLGDKEMRLIARNFDTFRDPNTDRILAHFQGAHPEQSGLQLGALDKFRQYANELSYSGGKRGQRLFSQLRDALDDLTDKSLADPRTSERYAQHLFGRKGAASEPRTTAPGGAPPAGAAPRPEPRQGPDQPLTIEQRQLPQRGTPTTAGPLSSRPWEVSPEGAVEGPRGFTTRPSPEVPETQALIPRPPSIPRVPAAPQAEVGLTPQQLGGTGPAQPPRRPREEGLGESERWVAQQRIAQTADTLGQARHAHFLRTTADKLSNLIHRREVMKRTPDARFMRVDLGALVDAVESPQSKIAKDVSARLGAIGGAEDRFDAMIERLQQNYRYIELERPRGRSFTNLPAQLFGTALLTPAGRQAFERAVVEGRGRISVNLLATIANDALRRAGVLHPGERGTEDRSSQTPSRGAPRAPQSRAPGNPGQRLAPQSVR